MLYRANSFSTFQPQLQLIKIQYYKNNIYLVYIKNWIRKILVTSVATVFGVSISVILSKHLFALQLVKQLLHVL